jgi:hypothetical protein
MTAFVLGQRTDQRPAPPPETREHVLLIPVGNALLEMGWLAERIEALAAKRARIVARLDDPTIAASQEQRSEAENRASALHYEKERHLKELRRLALGIGRHLAGLSPELVEWIGAVVIPAPGYAALRRVAGSDHVCMSQARWRTWLSARAGGETETGEEPPF